MKSALTSKLCLFLTLTGGLREQGLGLTENPGDLHSMLQAFKFLSSESTHFASREKSLVT